MASLTGRAILPGPEVYKISTYLCWLPCTPRGLATFFITLDRSYNHLESRKMTPTLSLHQERTKMYSGVAVQDGALVVVIRLYQLGPDMTVKLLILDGYQGWNLDWHRAWRFALEKIWIFKAVEKLKKLGACPTDSRMATDKVLGPNYKCPMVISLDLLLWEHQYQCQCQSRWLYVSGQGSMWYWGVPCSNFDTQLAPGRSQNHKNWIGRDFSRS